MNEQCILVAEDYEPLLAGIRDILEAEGYTVLTATDGVEALQIMEQTRPDLIVADIMMPALNGYALYETVRAQAEWATIPVVFLTSRAEEEDLLRGKALGVDGYITKPFDPDKLLVTVRTTLEKAYS
ncbi:MAG: response regulator [Chloroflexota bacterium]|nr:response regulator [Chloroflexota bacterium]